MERAGLTLSKAISSIIAVFVLCAITACQRSSSPDVEGTAPAIFAITPATLRPGEEATIRGDRFAAEPGDNMVTVAGVAVTVSSASRNRLIVRLPETSHFDCAPTRAVDVVVKVGDAAASRVQPLAVARPLEPLTRGQYLNLTTAADAVCNEIPLTGGKYLVSVYNIETSALSSSSFRLRGEASPALSSMGGTGGQTNVRGVFHNESAVSSPGLNGINRGGLTYGRDVPLNAGAAKHISHLDAHLSVLEENRKLMERLGPPRAGDRAVSVPKARSVEPRAVPQSLSVGDIVEMRFPNLFNSDCVEFPTLQTRVAYAGEKTVILEDVRSPLAGTLDEYFREIGEEYEEIILPVIEEYFGDPSAFHLTKGGDTRLRMVFTPEVNAIGREVGGFVTARDFYDRSECPVSNEVPAFYARVPLGIEQDWIYDDLNGAKRLLSAGIAHEVKHLASFAAKLINDAPLEQSWLEEGTAHIAVELYGRERYGYAWRGETKYQNSIYCEFRPELPECGAAPMVMWHPFLWFGRYLEDTASRSVLGGTVPLDGTVYGSAWSFVRWALDHHAVSESEFLRALVQDTERRGVANLLARTGVSFTELLGPWSLSLYWDEPSAPGLSFLSWDVRDVFNGLFEDGYASGRYPLRPLETGFGSFSLAVDELRGGSAALFLIQGTQEGSQLLQLQGYDGGQPPASLRIAILRAE